MKLPARPEFAALELDHLVIRVADFQRTRDFYVRVLGAEPVGLSYGRIGLRFRGAQVNLHGPDSTPHPIARGRPNPGSFDLCFRWPNTPEAAIKHLRSVGVEPELGPVLRVGALGNGLSIYFRDPDGNLVELITYLGG